MQFYNDDVLLIDAVSAFITAGLQGNATIIVVATEKHREELCNAWQAQGLHGGWVAKSDTIHLDGRGYRSTGLPERSCPHFGEMVAVRWAEGKTRAAIRLEELWNELATQHAFSLLCAYPMSGFPDQKDDLSFLQVCHTHMHVHPAQYTPLVSSLRSSATRHGSLASFDCSRRASQSEGDSPEPDRDASFSGEWFISTTTSLHPSPFDEPDLHHPSLKKKLITDVSLLARHA